MDLLVEASDVLGAMGLTADAAVSNTMAIESAILRAQIRLETYLKSSVVATSRQDMFILDEHASPPLHGMYRLRLSSTFVKVSSIVVTCGEEVETMASTPVTGYVFDVDKGILKVPTSYVKKIIQVTYTAGFVAGDDLPEEVKQAIICYTPVLLLTASAGTVDPKIAGEAMKRALQMENQGNYMASKFNAGLVGSVTKPVASSYTMTA